MNTIVGMIYDARRQHGVASAAALILFTINNASCVTMINMQVSKKRVHY